MSYENIQTHAAIAALNKMFSQGYFSICTIDAIAEMLSIRPAPIPYRILRTLHCVHYNTMSSELHESLPQLIQDCLDGQRIIQFALPKGSQVFQASLPLQAKRPWYLPGK